jgi:hypothetical protein
MHTSNKQSLCLKLQLMYVTQSNKYFETKREHLGSKMTKIQTLICGASATALMMGTQVQADSCWMHNGSVMRLQASGTSRTIAYERPRQGLAQIGVYPGRILFEGERYGQTMSGTARMYSTQRQGEETKYAVNGPISASGNRITLVGTRDTYNNGMPTGQVVQDRLVFTLIGPC